MIEFHSIFGKACTGHYDFHSLTDKREQGTSVSSLRMRNSNPATVSFSNHSESVEVGDVTNGYITLPALESGVTKLFRGLWWLKVLLILFFTSLLIRGLSLSALQGWDWDDMAFEDIGAARSALETITSMDIVDQPLEWEAFEGTRTGKVLRVPLAGPVLYTERMVDPTLYLPSYYRKSEFGVSLLPPAYRPKNCGKKDIRTRKRRLTP